MDDPKASETSVTNTKLELRGQFTLFAVLWALGSLLVAWQRMRLDPSSMNVWLQPAVAIAAFVLLVRPWSTSSLAVLSLMHVLHGAISLPRLSTTDLLWALCSAAILTSFAVGWSVQRSRNVSAAGLYRSFAPCLRLMFMLGILATCLARLNWQFLDGASSPVTSALAKARGGLLPPDWVTYLTMSMLLVVDLFLAVSLLIPSWRRFAVGFGTCYFAWQALVGYGEMRVMLPLMVAGLCLFLSSSAVGRIHSLFERAIPVPRLRSVGLAAITVVIAALAAAVWLQNHYLAGPHTMTARHVENLAHVAFATVWSVSLAAALIDHRTQLTRVSLIPRNPLHYLLIAGLILAAASPYVGWGSHGRFVESSGLTTAGVGNNHLLIPHFHLTDYEQDLVHIIDSNDEYLTGIADQNMLITWFEFVNYVAPRPATSVTFIRGENKYRVSRTGDVDELSTKNSWIVRKLLAFRLVDEAQQNAS